MFIPTWVLVAFVWVGSIAFTYFAFKTNIDNWVKKGGLQEFGAGIIVLVVVMLIGLIVGALSGGSMCDSYFQLWKC